MHTTARPSRGAEVLIDCLIRNGVDTVFAYPGGATLPIHQALVGAKDRLRTILPRHEQGGGWAASSYARATGKVGVAFATSGPGATNLVTCLADAQRCAIPMLAITGQVNKAVLGLDAFQEIPIVSVCRTITKHHFLVTDANDIPRVIRQALSICTSGRPGPVIVDVPKDLQAKQIVNDHEPAMQMTRPTVGKPSACDSPTEHPALARLWDLARARRRLGDTYITTGAGPALAWVAGSWRFPDPALWINSDSLGSLGFALPAAIGVQVGQPGKTVIAVDTPTSFTANVQELAGAFCEKLPVKVLLLRSDRARDEDADTDFVMLARGFRAGSQRVQSPEDLDTGLAAMLESAGPFLLDVAIPTRPSGRNHEAHLRQSPLRHRAAAPTAPAPAQDEDRPLYKTKYHVINVHRHCDKPSEESLKAELEVMDRVGVRTIVDLLMEGGWSDANLPAWMKLRAKYPERLVVFGYINWGKLKQKEFFEQLPREVELQHRLGVQGIKVWKDIGMYHKDSDGKLLRIDDPRLDPFWAKCGELALPILIHSADPKEYWYPLTYNTFHYGMTDRPRHYDNPNMPKWEDLMEQRDNVLKKHPRTKFIGAHFGSMTFDLQKLAQTLDKYPNFSVDCAARLRILGRLNPNAVRDFMTKYQDRVLFGTDSGFDKKFADEMDRKAWQDEAARFYSRHLEYFETNRLDIVEPYGHARDWLRIPGVKLPPEVLEKFYHANAERLIPGLKQR